MKDLAFRLQELVGVAESKVRELNKKLILADQHSIDNESFMHKLKAEGAVLKQREAQCKRYEDFELATQKLIESNSVNAANRAKLEVDISIFKESVKEIEENLALQQEAINKSQSGIERQRKQLERDIKHYKAEVLKQVAQENKV